MRKALCVGINSYAHCSRLYGCVNDATAVAQVLSRHGDGRVNFDVSLMCAEDFDSQVSCQSLKAAIRGLFDTEAEIAVFYFSGHGAIDAFGGYLCASDIEQPDEGVSLEYVMRCAESSNSHNNIIILDSCHSGAAGSPFVSGTSNNAWLKQGTTILAACGRDAYATERNGHGVFTDLLVEALEGGAMNLLGDVKRLSVLKSKQSGGDGSLNATISLSELYAMQQEVAAIPVPDAINELADDVLCELRGNGIEVSDRKYLNYYPLVQAKAWLEGHDKVESQDLLILKCYLWQAPGDRPTVENTLTRLCVNPLQDKVNSILAMAVEAQEDFNTVVVDGGNPKAGSKALLKLRGELLQLYKRQQELCAAAQSDSEKDMVNKLLNDLETISMAAHNAVNFTYIPLEQMAALQ